MGDPFTDRGFICLSDDRHQQALYRLSALGQYLYDTMNGDEDSDRDTPDPLPLLSMECVREAQRQIDRAIKNGQRTRRRCLGGELELIERPGPQAPPTRKEPRMSDEQNYKLSWEYIDPRRPNGMKLDNFGQEVREFFGHVPYQVGSSLWTRSWRDVDVRLILPDDEFEALLGKLTKPMALNARWNAACLAWSARGREVTGLPIDFQVQSQSYADENENEGPRNPIGWLHGSRCYRPEEAPRLDPAPSSPDREPGEAAPEGPRLGSMFTGYYTGPLHSRAEPDPPTKDPTTEEAGSDG